MNTFKVSDIIRLQPPFASGAEHNVCLHETDSIDNCKFVYKYPECFWNKNDAECMSENLNLLNGLGVQTLNTEILNPAYICVDGVLKSVPYVIKQEFSVEPTLTEIDLLDPLICSQLKEYVCISNELYLNENKAIDFLGAEALKCLISYFFKRNAPLKVCNFQINQANQILLVDTGVFSLDKINPVFRNLIHTLIQVQHYLIYKVLEFNGSVFDKIPYINPLNKSVAYPAFLATRIYHPFKKY